MPPVTVRVTLTSVSGETVVRDVVDGCWAEPAGSSEENLGDDLWALPGLIDGHSHFSRPTMDFEPGDPVGAELRARQALGGGVMLAFDKGWRDRTVVDLIDRVDEGDRPHIEAAGEMVAVPGGYYDGFAREIEPDTIEATVDEVVTGSAGWLKLVGDWPRPGAGPQPNFTTEQLARAVEATERRGGRVAVHTMARDVPSMAVAAGVHSIEHGLFLQMEDIDALAARDGIWVPTALHMEDIVQQLGPESSGGRLISEGLTNVAQLLPMASEAGVRILAGSDLSFSAELIGREAVRLREMGLTTRAALASVSSTGFEVAALQYGFSVGNGAEAVFYAANPLDDLRVLTSPRHVMRRGRVLS